MAGNDVFLFGVPSDVDSDDVRLRDPNSVGSPGFVLAATEAADTFAASVQEGLRLAATEAADTASFNVQEGLRLAATEASDTASFSVQEGLRLAATEAEDTFAGALVGGQNITFAATEQPDVMAGTLEAAGAAGSFELAATEGADTASGAVAAVEQPPVSVAGVAGGASVWPARRKRLLSDYPVLSYPAERPVAVEVVAATPPLPLVATPVAIARPELPSLSQISLPVGPLASSTDVANLVALIHQARDAQLAAALANALDEDDIEILLLAA